MKGCDYVVNKEELKIGRNNQTYDDGYRIVYFYEDGSYHIGEFCKTIEGFMIGFAENNPIIDNDDIPKFISNNDLLNRCSNYDANATSIAIYKTDGTLIEKIDTPLKRNL